MSGCEWQPDEKSVRHTVVRTPYGTLHTMPSNNANESLKQFISVRPPFFIWVNSFLTQLL
jgi:hypothetical protein